MNEVNEINSEGTEALSLLSNTTYVTQLSIRSQHPNRMRIKRHNYRRPTAGYLVKVLKNPLVPPVDSIKISDGNSAATQVIRHPLRKPH
jgi:hypothetical protein